MAHDVAFNIPERQLGKRDIVFRVRKDGSLFGTLRISKGGGDWFPFKKQLGYGFNWSQIAICSKRKAKSAGTRRARHSRAYAPKGALPAFGSNPMRRNSSLNRGSARKASRRGSVPSQTRITSCCW